MRPLEGRSAGFEEEGTLSIPAYIRNLQGAQQQQKRRFLFFQMLPATQHALAMAVVGETTSRALISPIITTVVIMRAVTSQQRKSDARNCIDGTPDTARMSEASRLALNDISRDSEHMQLQPTQSGK